MGNVSYMPHKKWSKDVNDEVLMGGQSISKSFSVETLADQIHFYHRSISQRDATTMLYDIIDRDEKQFSPYDFWCIYLPKVANLICKSNRRDLGDVTHLNMDKYLK